MKFDEVLKALSACKGDGTWLRVAKEAGLHYDTLARIARGGDTGIRAPSVLIVERIADVLERIEAEKSATDEARAA